MKARHRKTRWLLVTVLVGFLAAAGVTFVLHQHPARLLVSTGGIAPADDIPVQQADPVASTSMGDEQAPQVSTDVRGEDYAAAGMSSNKTQTAAANDSVVASTVPDEGGTNPPAQMTVVSGGETTPQTQTPPTSGDTGTPPQVAGVGAFANAGNLPFSCGLPAGCGGSSSELVQQSGTSGGTPSLHDSQGPGPQGGNSDSQTDHSSPPSDDSDPTTGNPGQKSDPSSPGSSQSVAAAPELDPSTLAAALTLLFGSLLIVRSRRVRATNR